MEANQFTEYLKSVSTEMQASRDKIRLLIGDRHWQTDGEHKEAILRKMLRTRIPSKLSVCRGFIVNHLEDGSGQIDILILDHFNKPILFQDNELVITTPDCVKGIIEVKTSINNSTELCEALSRLGDHLRLQKKFADFHAFGGLFIYDSDLSNKKILESLHKAAQKDHFRAVNWVCIGQDRFFRFWPNGTMPYDPPGGDSFWHSYELTNLAQGYFISNVIWDVSEQRTKGLFGVEQADKVWFPMPEGKESHMNASVGLQNGEVILNPMTNLWQPTDDNIFEYFDDKVGLKAWEAGKTSEATIDLDKNRFLQFLQGIAQADKEKLLDMLRKYDGCMSAINEGAFPYPPAFQLIVLMGLIELAMGNIGYVTLSEYLQRNISKDELISKEKLTELVSGYYSEFGQRKAYLRFFNYYLIVEEQAELLRYLKTCPEWESCNEIRDFVNKLEPYRHKFIHELSPNTLWPDSQRLVLSNGIKPAQIYSTVSPPFLNGIVWRGILRKFGYNFVP